MSSCADVVMELLSTKNGAVGAVVNVCWQFKSGSWSEQSCFLELQQYARSRDVMLTGVEHRAECLSSDDMTVGVNSGAKQSCFWSYSTSLEGVLADSDEDESRRGTLLRKFHMQKLNRISTAETQFIKSKIRVTGLHMEEDFHVCYSTLQKQVDVQMASSTDVFLGAAKQELWCTCSQRRRRFKKRNIAEKVNGTCKQGKFHMQKLNRISTAETQFITSKIRVTGLHMEEDFHVGYSTLQKQVDVQMASRTDVFLGAAKQELWCTCSQRRRRFKKRNIAEKVNGTCKQDFTCRNGLIAVPTVNKDFSCCETTQQKIQVPGVDREMCLKKEFYYCDSTLQKQGLSCSDAKEEDFKKESLLQLRPITRFQLQRCCRDVLTACDRKEIQQLCLDSSHETYIAVTVPHSLLLPETSVLYYLTSQLYYQASSDNKAPLWKQHNKKLYC
ncbi:hypothetical protein DPMN_088488 [Dreissena polymorpha]|uniref:Uncharacterized protein n=1 Tax=Dreissena polymorpha TaxID=45954 RepID=A0A9D4KUN1_DREPO|nr:hypothetical protein DPMN_088488 [Dreissena polymorpha]